MVKFWNLTDEDDNLIPLPKVALQTEEGRALLKQIPIVIVQTIFEATSEGDQVPPESTEPSKQPSTSPPPPDSPANEG